MLLFASLLRSVIEFLVEFFTHLTLRRAVGAAVFLFGCWLMAKGFETGDPDRFVLFAVFGILIGGMGAVAIYYDFAKDKASGLYRYSETETLTKALEQKQREERSVRRWHMEESSSKKD